MDFKDYAGYYIGCRCVNTWFPEGHEQYDNGWRLTGFLSTVMKPYELENDEDSVYTDSIKPILRKCGDQTEEEQDEVNKLKGRQLANAPFSELTIIYDTPEVFHWALKKGFDLFGLIDVGLAIDSKTLK